jgi:hypothetical protein
VQPLVAPNDVAHQLLFAIDGVAEMASLCAPFQVIRDMAPSPPAAVTWYTIGSSLSSSNLLAGSQWDPGFGQPQVYAYRHAIVSSAIPAIGVLQTTNTDATQYSQTIQQFADAVQKPLYSPVVSSTYFDANATLSNYITYIPDFTDCASSLPEDRVTDDQLYGVTTAVLVVEVYQAIQ